LKEKIKQLLALCETKLTTCRGHMIKQTTRLSIGRVNRAEETPRPERHM